MKTRFEFQIPATPPCNEAILLAALQSRLLQIAEERLGKRGEEVKELLPVEIKGSRPQIMWDDKKPFIRLSYHAEKSWEYTLFQLAHECVHLLNPIVGQTNYLEEGIAVHFQLLPDFRDKHNISISASGENYIKAHELVKKLPGDIWKSAKKIRKKCGSLSNAKSKDLKRLFPDLDVNDANSLCEEFPG